ncbi:MAG: phenylalanine--tRNA ligase subunit beta, partial [Candidatus Limnocylindrales bacterium]
AQDLVVADPDGPAAIAGVMGGAASEVGPSTTEVIIESAIFDPVSIRRTGQRYALRSEASLRFEKGQEFRLARIGADRVAGLIAQWAGARVAPGRADTAPTEPERGRLAFRPAALNRLLGTRLSEDEQRSTLERAGIATEAAPDDVAITIAGEPRPRSVDSPAAAAVVATIPSWRADLAVEADLAEEVARIRGYEAIPPTLPETIMPTYRPSPLAVRDLVRQTLAGAGLTEVITAALVSPRSIDTFGGPDRAGEPLAGDDPARGRPIRAVNPLSSEHAVLRQELVGSLLEVLDLNLHAGRADVAIFEVGKGYGYDEAGESVHEWWRLGLALSGAVRPAAWNQPAQPWQVDDAKGIVELLARRLDFAPPAWSALTDSRVWHPGRSARGTSPGDLAACVGELHPALRSELDLRAEHIVIAQIALRGLAGGAVPAVAVRPIPRVPAAERDLAVVVAQATPARRVQESIATAGGDLLVAAHLFDIYRGAPLNADERSLAYRLTFQADDRILGDAEVEALLAAIGRALAADVGGRIRS